jgi:hypothetical protein
MSSDPRMSRMKPPLMKRFDRVEILTMIWLATLTAAVLVFILSLISN